MKEFNEEYIEKLNDIIDQKDEAALKLEIKDMHPADLAELVEDLDTDEALFLLRLVLPYQK